MKKVLFISSANIHTKKFIDMVEEDIEIYLLTNRNNDIFEDSNIKKIYLWKKNILSNVFYTFKILNEIKPTLISIQQIGLVAFFYVFLLHKKYNILVTSWGSDVMIFPYKSLINKLITMYTLKKATYLSSIDSIGMISVVKCLSSFSKSVIPIKFGISKYIEFENNFDRKENIIYSPRSHAALYNIQNIIYSFEKFSKKESNWKLYLSGLEDDKITPKLKNLVKKLNIDDKVEFLGYLSQQENAKMFKRAKLVVSIPFSDGRPISVMEAIASNCIVICSDILANYELIQNNINGCIVDHNKEFDFSIYKRVNIDMMTKYNYQLSTDFQYKKAESEYKKLFKGLINDIDNR